MNVFLALPWWVFLLAGYAVIWGVLETIDTCRPDYWAVYEFKIYKGKS